MLEFLRSLFQHKVQLVTFIIISLVILLLPGQNNWQILTLDPQASTIQSDEAITPPPADIPILTSDIKELELTTRSAIVIDPESAAILYQRNPDTKMLPASTTKIMTALVALEQYDLDEVVTVTTAYEAIGHKANIFPGEQLTVHDLLYAMMLNSGNDAAVALAQHHPGGYHTFVSLMNQKARQLHLDNSHFTNVSGIEDDRHFVSARNLAILTKAALENDLFKQIVGTKEKYITSVSGKYQHNLKNINELLGSIEGVEGVKTGWTENAGECLVTVTRRNGRAIIAVVLNSADRFGESEALIDWTYTNYAWMPYSDLISTIQNQ